MKRIIQIMVWAVLLSSLIVQYDDGRLKLSTAYAQSNGVLTIGWTPPLAYTDGFPLIEQELDFYTFGCNGLSATLEKEIDSIIGTRSDAVDISGLPSGDYTCQLTVTSLLGAESGPSNSINFTIGARVPMAPALTTS